MCPDVAASLRLGRVLTLQVESTQFCPMVLSEYSAQFRPGPRQDVKQMLTWEIIHPNHRDWQQSKAGIFAVIATGPLIIWDFPSNISVLPYTGLIASCTRLGPT